MKLELWVVGKTRTKWVAAGEQEFCKRCRRYAEFERVIIPAERSGNSRQIRSTESDRLVHRLGRADRAANILLDENGVHLTSTEFSQTLQRHFDQHGGRVRFIIGGAYGVEERVKNAVDTIIALSPMTFPHELVRIVFLEQLYRAFTILRRESYHHV